MASSPWVIDADERTFAKAVLERSLETPVLVDFWAPWCGPCRMLSPILEKLADEMQGRFVLAKINSDENPNLSRQYQVRGIPACKLFAGGTVVDEFTGALPESALRQFLERAIPSRADKLVDQGMLQEQHGNPEAARECYTAALAEAPDHSGALLGLARLHLADGDESTAAALLERLDPLAAESPEAKALQARLAFSGNGATLAELEARVAEEPADLNARLSLGRALVGQQRVAEGLDQFLEVVRRDRQFDDQAGRKAVVQVFEMLGHDHPLVRTYRPKLSSLLFS